MADEERMERGPDTVAMSMAAAVVDRAPMAIAARDAAASVAAMRATPRWRPAQGMPLLRRQNAEGRLQGRAHAAELHHRGRQDRAEPHFGQLRASHQRQLAIAIKRARVIALLPFSTLGAVG